MYATIPTYALYGLDAIPADVLVGPNDVRVVERGIGRDLATRQACMQAELSVLGRRRSAPADLKKDAGGFDLPIALGLLLGSGQVAFERPGAFA
jgi:magnesium chelatase family protein